MKIDTTQLKNGKYYVGKYNEPNDHKGWFVGAFFDEGYPCKTDKVEVMYKEHKKIFTCVVSHIISSIIPDDR